MNGKIILTIRTVLFIGGTLYLFSFHWLLLLT